MAALFYDLTPEKTVKISSQSERRERDLQELFRRAKKPVALFVDDAHDLHPKTLIALKRLIELVAEGGGQLSIVLVGHPKLKNDLRRPKMEEIGDRTTVFEFGGLRDRQRDYIDWVLKASLEEGVVPDEVLTDEAATLLAAKLKTPLQIGQHLVRAFEAGFEIGSQADRRQHRRGNPVPSNRRTRTATDPQRLRHRAASSSSSTQSRPKSVSCSGASSTRAARRNSWTKCVPPGCRREPQRVFWRIVGAIGRPGAAARKPPVFRAPPTAPTPRLLPSHTFCVGMLDLASVSTSVRSISNSVRRTHPTVSANLRRKPPLIARRAVHHCAPLHLHLRQRRRDAEGRRPGAARRHARQLARTSRPPPVSQRHSNTPRARDAERAVAVPIEALATLRRRLAALPARHPERKPLMASTAQLYAVSRATLYRLLRGERRPKDAHRADRGRPRAMPAAEIERWCEIVAAMKVRTTNKKGRHLSTARI